jgi:hypothetical protein
METPGNRAGHLIQAKALGLILRWYCQLGKCPAAWDTIRRRLADEYPAASTQSREAVVRYAQQLATEMRRRDRVGPDFVPKVGADYSQVVRDRNRVRRHR